MPKYHVEVPHGSSMQACVQAMYAFMHSASHFIANSEWGCDDDVHKAWVIVEAADKDEVRMMLPPEFRKDAQITLLARYDRQKIDEIIHKHTH